MVKTLILQILLDQSLPFVTRKLIKTKTAMYALNFYQNRTKQIYKVNRKQEVRQIRIQNDTDYKLKRKRT